MGHRVLHDMLVAPFMVPVPATGGSLKIDRWGSVVPVVTSTTAYALTLAVPTKAGLDVTVVLRTDGTGNLTLTVTSGYNTSGDTAIVFSDAGDWVKFISVKIGDNFRWRIVAQEGTNAILTGGGTIESQTVEAETVTDLTATSLKLAVTAVAAAGSVIGEGGDLVAGINIVSAADNTKCVDLPATVAGTVVVVSSQTAAKTLPVFPPAGSSIDNASANAAITIGAATATTGAIFFADNSTHWVSILGDTA